MIDAGASLDWGLDGALRRRVLRPGRSLPHQAVQTVSEEPRAARQHSHGLQDTASHRRRRLGLHAIEGFEERLTIGAGGKHDRSVLAECYQPHFGGPGDELGELTRRSPRGVQAGWAGHPVAIMLLLVSITITTAARLTGSGIAATGRAIATERTVSAIR